MVIRKERGFTLIELMIVLAIIGVLLTIVLPRVGNILDRADERATLKNLQNLQLAIEAFADMNNGKYPTVLGSDANNNGIGDIGEIMMEYFGDRWPVAKLRRGVKATRVNAGISFGPVIDVDKDGFITTTDIIYSIKDACDCGGWFYITYQPPNTRPCVVGTVVINCTEFMTDGKTRYCEIMYR